MNLLETMLVEAGGTISLLERHLTRVAASADVLGFRCDVGMLRAALLREAASNPDIMLRLLLARDGGFEVQHKPLTPLGITHLRLAAQQVNSADPMLRHKTTNRAIYKGAADAILVNQRGEATETGIANIAAMRNGRWTTPPVDCGLLPGTRRAELLALGEVEEGILQANALVAGEIIRYFNARGVFQASFSPPPTDS